MLEDAIALGQYVEEGTERVAANNEVGVEEDSQEDLSQQNGNQDQALMHHFHLH
jgi:hypothetical protein